MNEQNNPILEVKNLRVSYHTYAGEVKAVRGVQFSLEKGQALAIVGESGCGKTVTAKSILRLFGRTTGTIADGSQILFEGKDILKMDKNELSDLRGAGISMIFQDSMTSLNPTMRVGKQIAECIRLHNRVSRQEAMQRACELLRLVEIPNPEERLKNYPHQMSGGMRQRVMIAMALSCNPKILIADEPTTALDVTIQAQILDLMKSLQKELGMAIILITHDLGVVAQMCDEVIVMYAGSICEQGTADEIFYNPCHEYTKGLLRSIPSASNVGEKLEPIHGTPIDLLNMPAGCPFAPRCEAAMKICLRERAERMRINEDHLASCWMNVKKGLEDGSIELAEDKDAERKDGADA